MEQGEYQVLDKDQLQLENERLLFESQARERFLSS